ncbi:MAG: DUF4253 domain-containing protein [Planctomycetota bacterium]
MNEFRSSTPGQLPPPGTTVAGISLPAGALIHVDPGFASQPSDAAVAWVSTAPLQDLPRTWRAFAAAFGETGLWPIVCDSLKDEGRPWTSGEFDGPRPVATTPPAQLLARLWESAVPVAEETELDAIEPFDRSFPGLAPATSPDGDVETDAPTAVVARLEGRLGLVAVTRPADVLAALGWSGACNHHDDPGELSAVLRSWEDRFGAVLVGVGFDTVTLAVSRPPRTVEQALPIAAELFAICSDIVYQGLESIEALADELVDCDQWSLWWD